MAAKSKALPPRVFTDQELEQVARDIVARAPGLSGSDFKKELTSEYKKSDKRVVDAASQLAGRRELYRWSSAKKVRFFRSDPFDALAQSVVQAITEGPLSETAIRLKVESSHRGFGDLSKEWLKAALARGDVFVHPPAKGSKLKRFGVNPDVGGLLKTVFTALRKVLATPTGKRVRKAQLLEAIFAELETISPSGSTSQPTERERFLLQLFALALETSTKGLLSIRDLRARLPFDKQQFDRVALELMRDELVTLHHHDFPESLSETDRAELVVDNRGNHFVGLALRAP